MPDILQVAVFITVTIWKLIFERIVQQFSLLNFTSLFNERNLFELEMLLQKVKGVTDAIMVN